MRYFFAILLSTILFAACGTAPATNTKPTAASPTQPPMVEPQKASIDPTIVDFLLTSAAKDFHDHSKPGPARFRNVQIGHAAGSDGKPQYTMCGEFLPKGQEDTGEWLAFTTIKTSGYEQYVGKMASSHCQELTWDSVGDQSAALQGKLDALR